MTITTTIRMGMATTKSIMRMADRPGHGERFEFWRHGRWWRAWAVAGFGPMFFVFVALAILSGLLVWWLKGEAVFQEALADDVAMLVDTVPRVIGAVAVAGLLWVLIPRERIAGLIGRESGVLGLIFAAVAGTITPGGPTSAFALLAMIGGMGADRGLMVSYITAWATLGLQRILTWDVPMMGFDFSSLRFLSTLPLPVLAGMLARALPVAVVLKAETRLRDRM